jgi:hypothetical protein
MPDTVCGNNDWRNPADLDRDGNAELLIEDYSDGASCCTTWHLFRIAGTELSEPLTVSNGNVDPKARLPHLSWDTLDAHTYHALLPGTTQLFGSPYQVRFSTTTPTATHCSRTVGPFSIERWRIRWATPIHNRGQRVLVRQQGALPRDRRQHARRINAARDPFGPPCRPAAQRSQRTRRMQPDRLDAIDDPAPRRRIKRLP